MNNHKAQKGFTLVEMSIVLVIIGLILGAVSVGKDLQRDAEYNKIKQKFVDQWVQSYNTYYQRTGVVIGDNQTQPRFMVGGAAYAPALGPTSGGNMSAVVTPAVICQGARGPNMTAGANDVLTLHTFFDQTGIRMPAGRAEGQEDRYVYLDTNGNPQEVQICFQWQPPTTPSGSGNVMVIDGLTPDLARRLDQMIDGKADSRNGMFRQDGVANGGGAQVGTPGIQWASDNEDSLSGNNRNRDEDQVITVVAIYKMNQ